MKTSCPLLTCVAVAGELNWPEHVVRTLSGHWVTSVAPCVERGPVSFPLNKAELGDHYPARTANMATALKLEKY